MKQLLCEYADYHLSANRILGEFISGLDPQFHTRVVAGSFPSLHKTLQHMWDADGIWWQRMHGVKNTERYGSGFTGDTSELLPHLLSLDEQWVNYTSLLDMNQLQSEFHYSNTKGEPFVQPLYQILLHLFNHGTYHRGQLVTMMRAMEITGIPATDFVHLTRTKK